MRSAAARAARGLMAPLLLIAGLAGCSEGVSHLALAETQGPEPHLPEARAQVLPTLLVAPAAGWTDTAAPTPAPGLTVTAFARGLDHPRWLHVLPNGDVLVAEAAAPPKPPGEGGGFKQWVMGMVMKRAGSNVPSADRITLLRDADGDGVAETRHVLLDREGGLMSPFGMALVGPHLYVANADALVRYDYVPGSQRIAGPATRVASLPAGLNHHWTKNLLASPDGARLYITVGSNSNIGENGLEAEHNRAAIWELDIASGRQRLFATGLRNPNGMAWEPVTGALWTVVNERDLIGNDLAPDYLTSVRDGGFYGWPWSYWGQHVDTRVQPLDAARVAQAIRPDYSLGSHVAPLGLAFAPGPARADGQQTMRWPQAFASGAFVGQHGSWNRRPRSGYNVVFVPFREGRPAGLPITVLDGFVGADGRARGRPVSVAIDGRGALLVADDVGNAIWRVKPDS
ncbi:MAG: sorbosone dehydrogenase family protein [Burkholderiales bacterium]|nr:sorbosone dehydrogenase family protein [Burkholderiales bacterium]